MSIILTVEYKAQILADFVSGVTAEEIKTSSEYFDEAVEKVLKLERYKRVKIDPDYKRYGLDLGLVSESKADLADACYDIANATQDHDSLVPILFESFEGVPHD